MCHEITFLLIFWLGRLELGTESILLSYLPIHLTFSLHVYYGCNTIQFYTDYTNSKKSIITIKEHYSLIVGQC